VLISLKNPDIAMLTQPIPDLTHEDILRVVTREFPSERHAEVHGILSVYGRESWQCGENRVRMAALKLANGDIERLRHQINRSTLDYHGVIAEAEYPAFTIKVTSCGLPTDDEHCEHAAHAKEAISQDWQQYQDWLTK
jgi:hypothetical protein